MAKLNDFSDMEPMIQRDNVGHDYESKNNIIQLLGDTEFKRADKAPLCAAACSWCDITQKPCG